VSAGRATIILYGEILHTGVRDAVGPEENSGCCPQRAGATRATFHVVTGSVILPEFAIVEPLRDHEHLRPSV
jgi:hypothetical protein